MKQHPLYQQIEEMALSGDYTIDQMLNANRKQLEAATGKDLSGYKSSFLKGLKQVVAKRLKHRDTDGHKSFALARIEAAFEIRFGIKPDIDHDEEGDKPFLKIWYKGRPK